MEEAKAIVSPDLLLYNDYQYFLSIVGFETDKTSTFVGDRKRLP